MSNVYYYPENCDLKVIGHLEEPNMDYEFHILGVWRDPKSGKMFWAEDSGCSCPVPFEDYYFKCENDNNLNSSMEELYEVIESFPCSDEEKKMLLGWMK